MLKENNIRVDDMSLKEIGFIVSVIIVVLVIAMNFRYYTSLVRRVSKRKTNSKKA